MTAPAIQTPPRLEKEPAGGVLVFLDCAPPPRREGPGGGCDLPPPPPAGPLVRRVRDIPITTAHGSPSAPVRFARDRRFPAHAFPCAHARGATTTNHHATKGTA